MYDELVKRLRELASIPEHCENVADCDQCSKEDICLSFTNKRIIEIATQAADAIEELSKALATVQDAHNEGYDVGYWAGRRDYEPTWIPVTERLPEHEYGESTSVLTVDLYGVMRVTYFDGGNWCWPSGEALTTMRVAPITHWMPLPSTEGLNET